MSEGVVGMDIIVQAKCILNLLTAIDLTEAIVSKDDNCWPWITWLTDR